MVAEPVVQTRCWSGQSLLSAGRRVLPIGEILTCSIIVLLLSESTATAAEQASSWIVVLLPESSAAEHDEGLVEVR